MQSSPLVSVDMMSAGPPASTSAPKTGQDGIFAAHLTAASHGQSATTTQAKTANKQESPPTADKQIQDSGNASTAQPKDALNTQETEHDTTGKTTAPGYNLAAQLKEILNTKETGNDTTGKTGAPGYNLALQLKEILTAKETGNDTAGKNTASDDTTSKGDSNDDLTSDATLQSSAGAANAAIIPLYWTGADIGPQINQSIAKTLNNESTLSRMLNAITSAANGTTGAPPPNSATTPIQAGATASEQSDPAVQSFTIEAKQPLLPTNQTIVVPGIAGNDAASLQSQATVSFVPDATPSVEAASLTEKPTSASPAITAQSQAAAIQTPAQQNPAQQGGDQIVQNKYGQIITIYQASESQEMAAATSVDSEPLATVTTGKNIDANNNFIQSHLPNDAAPKPLEKESGSQQQDTAKDNQQKGANTAKTITNMQFQPEQLALQSSPLTVGTENQSLIFHNQQVGTPLISTPLADTSSLRLPSGLTVPGETVVDQMISHFSVNNRLESGTVNLKLHPQELGELRMEIKITQDTVKAHFIAQTPQAQEMITQHLPRLREALEQQGLHLQQIDVTIAANDSFSRDQFQGHTGQQQLNQSMHNSRGNQPIFTLDAGEETQEATQIINNLSVMA